MQRLYCRGKAKTSRFCKRRWESVHCHWFQYRDWKRDCEGIGEEGMYCVYGMQRHGEMSNGKMKITLISLRFNYLSNWW